MKASQGLVDPQGKSTGLSQGRAPQLCFIPQPIHLHMVLSSGLEGKELIFFQEPHTMQGWSQITLWKVYFRLMSPINTALKTFLMTEHRSTMMWDTYEQNTRKTPWGNRLLLRKCWGKERNHRNIDQMATFLYFCLITKGSKCSKFPVTSADLKQTWKYYLAPAVFNFCFHLSFLNYFPGNIHAVGISLLSFSFSELCGP